MGVAMPAMAPSLEQAGLPWETPRLVLRLPRPSDAAALSAAGNYRSVARGTFVPYPFTPERARQAIRRSLSAAARGEALGLLLEERSTGAVLGRFGLGNLHLRDAETELFYWLSPPYWGEGYATEAVAELLRRAFGPLRRHRVTAHVHEFNERSIHLVERFGFRREGRVREARREKGKWCDLLLFGLLDREYRGLPAELRSPPRTRRPT